VIPGERVDMGSLAGIKLRDGTRWLGELSFSGIDHGCLLPLVTSPCNARHIILGLKHIGARAEWSRSTV